MATQSQSSNEDDTVIIDRDDISNYNPEQILPLSTREYMEVRKWLQATDYAHESGEYRKHLASHMDGTGTWLTTSETFQKWLKSDDHGLLWIRGIPGSGKSVASAHIVNLLKQSLPGSPVLYFYFRQIIDANHSPAALLRDWLDQILEYSPPLQKQLHEITKAKRSVTSLSMDDLWNYLRIAFAGLPGNAFCVADALDEMDGDNDQFLQALATLGQWRPNKVKILITSRPVPSVETPLRRLDMLHIRLEESIVDKDISTYVERELETSKFPSHEQSLIREAIPGHANGIFLYAKLAMDAFLEPGAKIEALVRDLPTDLHNMYTSLLHEHSMRSGVSHEIQLLILQWVTHATRPLRLIELAEMIRITHQPTNGQDTKVDLTSAKGLVRAATGPLLEILPNETVCVIHHSFTEYLKCMTRSETDNGYPILRFGETHGRLARACLMYLQAGCLTSISVAEESDENDGTIADIIDEGMCYMEGYERGHSAEEQQARLQYPFFAYAAANWHVHVTRSHSAGFAPDDINLDLDQLFSKKRSMKAWLKLHWSGNQNSSRGVTPLHIAARYGLFDYARSLMSKHTDVNARDVDGKTPIWWAANSGHADIIRFLVHTGGDPDTEDSVRGLKPLHEAANENHADAVRALLEAGVDPLTPKTRENPGMRCGNAPRSRGHTPLMYACHNGHLEALEAFLPFLKDIDTVHRALRWSARKGRAKLVNRILEHPDVQVNDKVRGDTALYSACCSADRDTINAVLEGGADVNILCSALRDEFAGIGGWGRYSEVDDPTRGYTALYALCNSEERIYSSNKLSDDEFGDTFSLLLEKGVNVEQRTPGGKTALHFAGDNPALARMILQAGADANALDDNGRTPLHGNKSPDAVSILVEEGGANINAICTRDGRSPLLCMLGDNRAAASKKLLEYCPDLTIKDKNGNGPLHLALSRYSVDTTLIEALLDAGADPNERNHAGETPLLFMRVNDRESVALSSLLLKAGADINAKDALGITLLARAIDSHTGSSSHLDTTSLVEKGADLQTRDYNGRTLLHRAVGKHQGTEDVPWWDTKHVSSLDFILGLGLDPQLVDYRGNTLIHELALRPDTLEAGTGARYLPLWEQLLTLGIDINQENNQGRTALHMLAAARPRSWCGNGVYGLLGFILSKVRDIDHRDRKGLTALHLASTVSEDTTKKLLDAGADPSLQTFEGLTPLHLAARARLSNTIGLLITIGKNCSSFSVDTRDKAGYTPLYYACQSGRPESVQLLLEAGADVSDGSMFLACTKFEDEQKLWTIPRHPADKETNQDASGLTMSDSTRLVTNMDTYGYAYQIDTIRLEEIIDLLVAKGCDTSKLVGTKCRAGNIQEAVTNGHNYAFSCLLRAKYAKNLTRSAKKDGDHSHKDLMTMESESEPESENEMNLNPVKFEETTIRAYQRAQIKAVSQLKAMEHNVANTHAKERLVTHLLRTRRYHAIRPLFHTGVDFLAQEGNGSHLLGILIEHGFDSLFEEIGSLEVNRKLAEGQWHAFGNRDLPGLYCDPPSEETTYPDRIQSNSLLLTAVKRDLPNMNIVRLLVEKFHVDINQRRYEKTYSKSGYEMLPQETALHHLAMGMHWWHVALALPYLISQGADIEAKDSFGSTPLHFALGKSPQYADTFSKDAARVLVAAGADVNAIDSQGKSCLANSKCNLEMIQLLLDHGASVGADSLFMAIEAKRVDILEALLRAGGGPNMRLEPEPTPSLSTRKQRVMAYLYEPDPPKHEVYPLYAAAKKHTAGNSHCSKDRMVEVYKASREAIQLVELLLESGANPMATMKRKYRYYDTVNKESENVDAVKEVTLLHELLEENELVHPILQHGSFDINHGDAEGRTIMHVIARVHNLRDPIDILFEAGSADFTSTLPSFLDYLLARGADPLATDTKGRNILHHSFENKKRSQSSNQDISTLTYLTNEYSNLINEANIYGKTPLHLALKHGLYRCDVAPVAVLLEAGANPFATDNDGNGCLHILSSSIYQSEIIRSLFHKLVGRGLDINAKNNLGETPIYNLYKPFTSEFCPIPKEGDVLTTSKALEFFEALGVDLFIKDIHGRGLLHTIANGKLEDTAAFQALVQRGLDPMLEDDQKRTALDIAAACNKHGILQLFEKNHPAVL